MSNSPTLNVALQASSCTTPRKPTSGQVSASGLPKAPRSQQTPLDAMPLELGDQVWEFDVKTTRSMLSPKRLRSDVNKKDPYPPLDSFACFVDDPEVQQAIKSMPQPDVLSGWDPDDEKVSYKPTATFLNNCVDNCYDALAKLRQSHEDLRNCWWPTTLKFFVYDKETKDGVEGSASPLKPHLVGVASDEAGNDPGASGILLPVEVQKNWTEIIKQAATYARAMVSAAPLRLFSVVIGVNHERETLRFLIYHRGGLTMSHEISLQEPQGRHDVQSIIFAILLWRNHEDAGFPSFTTGTVSLLPSRDKDKPVTLITNKVLFKSLSIRGRGTYVLWATIARRQHTLSCDEPVDEEPSVNDKCKEPWRHQPYTPCYTPPSNFIGTPRPITYEQFPDGIVIKYSFLDSAKRGVETHVHDSCSDQFGVPTHLCTFEACRSDGGAFSNSFLLPSDGSFEEHRWRHAFASSRRLPDRRTLQVIVTVEKGASLEHCKSAAELFKCVLHAQIGE
ncbi:hypothetical protein C8Q80DRAFT_1139573 [Daedaleopsis nitida]|nr:hypothetical protein C8Q80DRAFT_1139573 [Daedaleopsis nitida]